MEKRQHLFSAGVIQPLQPHQVGFYGMGSVSDLGVDIQGAEKEIERKFGSSPVSTEGEKGLRGTDIGAGSARREKLL